MGGGHSRDSAYRWNLVGGGGCGSPGGLQPGWRLILMNQKPTESIKQTVTSRIPRNHHKSGIFMTMLIDVVVVCILLMGKDNGAIKILTTGQLGIIGLRGLPLSNSRRSSFVSRQHNPRIAPGATHRRRRRFRTRHRRRCRNTFDWFEKFSNYVITPVVNHSQLPGLSASPASSTCPLL